MTGLPRARELSAEVEVITGPRPPPGQAYVQEIGRLIAARSGEGEEFLRCRVPAALTRAVQRDLGRAGYVVFWLHRERLEPTGRLEINWSPELLAAYDEMQQSTEFMASQTAEYVFRNGRPREDTTVPDTWWNRLWGQQIDDYAPVEPVPV